MSDQQKQAFAHDAKEREDKMREEGYMSSDIVLVAYYMLKNNIDQAEKMEGLSNDLSELLEKTEKLLEKM